MQELAVSISGLEDSKFVNHIIQKHALTKVNLTAEDVNLDKGKQLAQETVLALGAEDATQLMLTAQMSAVHDLQQKLTIYAANTMHPDTTAYYINAVTKLSNVFVQQVDLLNKLKGHGERKVVVEHVHVHNGGQAIVGNVEPYTSKEVKE